MSRIFALLAFLAVASSMMMPFGFMPAKAEDGSFILRICDGTMRMPSGMQDHAMHGATHREVQSHGEHHISPDGQDSMTHETRCNYAVMFAANLPDPPCIERCEQVMPALQPHVLPVLTAIFPPHLPPSTGPPAV